ncbi:NAD(P)-binding protein [Mycena chlorophos]|uniref:NAD(P)-binding protein n=1 Tax=Mycena chlorophos TaxID=658473 RepID=A0A8H6S396_MYCCL|nr:NAD(P)-binding protein [Mycena chlorophos]
MPKFFVKVVAKFQRFFPPNHINPPRRPARQRLQPIHRLAPEILARIFLALAHSDPFDVTTDFVPFTVSHVCRLWRLIALHTPSLWRRIPLVINNNMEGQLHVLQTRVQNARNASLDVCLRTHRAMRVWGRARPVLQRLDGDSLERAMRYIAPQAHRWRSLEIVISNNSYEPLLMSAALAGLRYRNVSGPKGLLLEHLVLVFRGNDDASEFYLFSGAAPRLRRLVLDGVRIAWVPTLVGALTFLDYAHHAFTDGERAAAELLHALRACVALRELRILFPDRKALLPISDDSVVRRRRMLPATMRQLRTLQLRVDGDEIPKAMLYLLTMLRMPALQTLELVDLGRRRRAFPNLRAFQRVCPCSYEVLRVEGRHGFSPNGRQFVNYPAERLRLFLLALIAMASLGLQSIYDLTGLVGLVTGGGSGIGYMIATGLAANGAKVYITGRRKDVLDKVVDAWNAKPEAERKAGMVAVQMDVTNQESILGVKKLIEEKEGKLHILVNNAGQVGPTSPFSSDPQAPERKDAETFGMALFKNETFDQWADLYKINTFSIFFVSTAFLGLLEKGTQEGTKWPGFTSSIINITSISGVIKLAQDHFAYNSAKAAASHLTRMLATEFALKGANVRVNAIAPGVYASEMTFDEIPPEIVDKIGKGITPVPARRAGTAEEMAGTVIYLASPAGCYTNGQEIVIDGGYVAVNPAT